ncbi:MAG: outer membrane protein assembly factor BamD [Hydrotalea sp.]|nr:outer membrane protein assembly factor BamD [Hydrotalea sp.]
MLKKIFSLPRTLLLLMLLAFLPACANDTPPLNGGTAEDTYNLGIGLYRDGNFVQAAKTFETIPYNFPYSKAVKNSYIMAAYSYYQAQDQVNAGALVDVFLSLYPSDNLSSYALYLRGMSYFEQIEDARRDQSLTEESLKSFNQLITSFPNTIYAKDAASKRGLLLDQLAAKEMNVGRFYLNRGESTAAINRFKTVIDSYGQTSAVPEALARLVEIYTMAGVKDEAQRYAALLGKNYPASPWYRYSYDLVMKNKKATPPATRPDKPLDKTKPNKKIITPPSTLPTKPSNSQTPGAQ